MATFVLIHGAWAGGWIWKKVALRLRAAGHAVYAPTLTGLGERVHLARPDIDLDTSIQDIVNVLQFEDLADVILVGWSSGGTVITGVADRVPERIARLVYLDAIVPEDGQSEFDATPGGATWLATERAVAAAAGTPDFWPVPVAYIHQTVPEEADRVWLLDRLAPQPFAALTQPVRLRNPMAAALRRTYIRCLDGAEPADLAAPYLIRARTGPGWEYCELASTHMAPVVAPHLTSELLLSLV